MGILILSWLEEYLRILLQINCPWSLITYLFKQHNFENEFYIVATRCAAELNQFFYIGIPPTNNNNTHPPTPPFPLPFFIPPPSIVNFHNMRTPSTTSQTEHRTRNTPTRGKKCKLNMNLQPAQQIYIIQYITRHKTYFNYRSSI